MKIKKGDKVIVLSGKDRGKTGTVLQAFPKLGQVLVEGLRVVTRHEKSRRVRSQGQIIKRSIPVPVSTVALIEGDKPVRVGHTVKGTGEKAKKVRVSRRSGETI